MQRKRSGPGRSDREGMSLVQLFEMFPDEKAARIWLEEIRWPNGGMFCPLCGVVDDVRKVAKEKPMPYFCRSCKKYFSVRTGTVMQGSNIPLNKWVIAMYLMGTNLKSVSSMKLHRDLNITQKSAWYLSHRLREAWVEGYSFLFKGPVEADETYIGGKERNKRWNQKTNAGRGTVGKTAVAGIKDRRTNRIRAQVVPDTTGKTLRKFVNDNIRPGSRVYTDDALAYNGLRNHRSVRHSVGEYVRGQAHTNGMESFWSMLKRAHKGTFHRLSPKHLQRYVAEFAGRHNVRSMDTLDQMAVIAKGLTGKRLSYRDLIRED